MSQISLSIRTTLDDPSCKSRLDSVSQKLTERYQASCQWQGNRLKISHSSLAGHIDIQNGVIQVEATLRFPLSMMKSTIETEIKKIIEQTFTEVTL